jgi:SOS-response transcriptional repressor LexA
MPRNCKPPPSQKHRVKQLQPLTVRQREVYDYIRAYYELKGYSPSLTTIADHFGRSRIATHAVRIEIEWKGWLRRTESKATPIPTTGVCPHCGQPLPGKTK